MTSPFHDDFRLPAHADVFAPLLAQLDDGDLGIDTVDFLQRTGPIFHAYADATAPRRITTRTGSHKNPVVTDYYVICRGMMPRGTFGYRIIAVDARGRLDIMDIDRLLDDAELFRGRLSATRAENLERLRRGLETRFQSMLDRGLGYIARAMRSEMEWIDDCSFLARPDRLPIQHLGGARTAFAREMLNTLKDFIQDRPKLQAYLEKHLIAALEAHDTGRTQAQTALLQDAYGRLDAGVRALLENNPSSLRVGTYRWLTDYREPALAARRRLLAQACPILLLTDGYHRHPVVEAYERNDTMSPDAAIAQIFHTTDPARAAFYKSLRESDTGAENARHLPGIARHLEAQKRYLSQPRTQAEWARLGVLISAAQATARVLERDENRVFADLAMPDPDRGDVLARHFHVRTYNGYARLEELRVLRKRIAASILAPKIITEADNRQLDIPIQHVFYMAAGHELAPRETLAGMPKKLRHVFNGGDRPRPLIHTMLEGVPVPVLLDAAMDFSTHRHDWDQQLRELIITNRLDERGAAYDLPALPVVRLPEYGYTIVPIRQQAELTKIARRLRSLMVFDGQEAILSGTHFVAIMRREGMVSAIAKIREPQERNARWEVAHVETAPGGYRNINFEIVARAYVDSQEFLKAVHIPTFAAVRESLRQRLERQAKSEELMGLNARDVEEKKTVLQILDPYIHVAGDYEVDEYGCLSNPKINAAVNALLRTVAPHYRHTGVDVSRLPRGPVPEIG